jgi:DnaJ-class molecular chaperone
MGPETILFVVILVVVVVVMSRFSFAPKVRCTRCDGTGQVNERWPDPSEPGGWHRVEGTCPKCKGKGTVASGRT